MKKSPEEVKREQEKMVVTADLEHLESQFRKLTVVKEDTAVIQGMEANL